MKFNINQNSATVKVPGTCGELVQGMLNGKKFLVTCPIKIFSYVTASIVPKNKKELPKEKWKSELTLKKTLEHFNTEKLYEKIQVEISSYIPPAKGMASSTADIVGVCVATAKLLQKQISEKEIADIAISIEPSDGTMFKGIVVFDYLEGKEMRYLGDAPNMKIFIVDIGGEVDTVEFNKNDYREILSKNEDKIAESLELVEKGIKKNDVTLIGKGATISAIVNQEILFKPELEKIIRICEEIGGLGVNVAHSGTVIGILLPDNFDKFDTLEEKIIKSFDRNFKFYRTELTNGGAQIIQRNEDIKNEF